MNIRSDVNGTPNADVTGFELKITGLRADASGVGHGGEITAEVKVNGNYRRHRSDEGGEPSSNGLDPVVKAGEGTGVRRRR